LLMLTSSAIHGPLFADLLENGPALFVQAGIAGTGGRFKAQAGGRPAVEQEDRRFEDLHAHDRGSPEQIDEIDGAVKRHGESFLEVETEDGIEGSRGEDGDIHVASRDRLPRGRGAETICGQKVRKGLLKSREDQGVIPPIHGIPVPGFAGRLPPMRPPEKRKAGADKT
jgi:hypothetical protein